MKKFEQLEDRVIDLQKIDKGHQQLNGKLNVIITELQEDLKIKDKEIGRMMKKINKLESNIR